MADQIETEFNITEGPSKFDLMSALFVSTAQSPHRVKFTIQQRLPGSTKPASAPRVVEVGIDSVEREDGSGQSWNIRGMVVGEGKRFRCYYDTRRRTGAFAILKK